MIKILKIESRFYSRKGENAMKDKHLKVATGCYINLFYEVGYSSITKTSVDIFIILPEYQGDDYDVNEIQDKVETVLYGISSFNDSIEGIREKLNDAFINEDWQIIVKKAR